MVSPLPNTNSSRKAVSLLKYSAKEERNGNEQVSKNQKAFKKETYFILVLLKLPCAQSSSLSEVRLTCPRQVAMQKDSAAHYSQVSG